MTLPDSAKFLMISLLLLAGCATSDEPQSQVGCPPDTIEILDEDTGRYDCVTQLEWEQILRVLEEDNW